MKTILQRIKKEIKKARKRGDETVEIDFFPGRQSGQMYLVSKTQLFDLYHLLSNEYQVVVTDCGMKIFLSSRSFQQTIQEMRALSVF